MLPTITAAALSPQTVAAGGQVLISVTIEEKYLDVADVHLRMQLEKLETYPMKKFDFTKEEDGS